MMVRKAKATTKGAGELVLVADIGGTTTRFGIAELKKNEAPRLLFVEERPTSRVKDISRTCAEFLGRVHQRLDRRPKRGCIAVAGPCAAGVGRMTNAKLVADERQLTKKLKIKILVINDFEALAYAMPLLGAHDIVTLRKGKRGSPVALVGAGTGLGKALILGDGTETRVLPSEGGHADFPFQENQQPLRDFLMKELSTAAITYEDVLSGRGLERLYLYLRQTAFRDDALPAQLRGTEVTATRRENRCSEAALELFIRLLARCCRNFILETGAFGGLVVAGGIAARNSDAFGEQFLREVANHPNRQYRALLEKVPVMLVTRLDAGLLGAALRVEGKG
jgi:glucokinase